MDLIAGGVQLCFECALVRGRLLEMIVVVYFYHGNIGVLAGI